MKIVVMILCAFLLKAEAAAQTWHKISPDNAETLHSFLMVKDSAQRAHVFGLESATLFHYFNGKWDSTANWIGGQCCVHCFNRHKYTYDKKTHFESITELAKNTVLIRSGINGSGCDVLMPYDTPLPSHILPVNSLSQVNLTIDKRQLDLSNYHWELQYSPLSNSFYLLSNGHIKIVDMNSLKTEITDLPTLDSLYSEVEYIGSDKIFLDKRNRETIYVTRRAVEVKFDEVYIFSLIFQSRDNGKNWKAIYKDVDINYDSDQQFVVNEMFFPQDTGFILMNTFTNVLRLNKTSGQIDTVLQEKAANIHFAENSNITLAFPGENYYHRSVNGGATWSKIQHSFSLRKTALFQPVLKELRNILYLGTESGEIYRSTDTGETWSLFASGFSTKPVIGIYASGNDSLVIGTEDGIWANYALPVSVAEVIPFKKAEFSITPNPANSSLKISFLKTELPQQLFIYNSLGQLVFKTEFSGEFTWDFKNNIADGVYTVAVQSGGKSSVKQFVIMR